MRPLIVIAAALAIAGCGKNQSGNSENVGESLSAENIVTNDVTAIDAVTGDSANMAADVEINADLNNTIENATTPQAAPATPPAQHKRAPAKPAAQTPAPARAPTNSAE